MLSFICICVYVPTYVCIYIYLYIHMCLYKCVSLCMSKYKKCIYTHTYTNIQKYINVPWHCNESTFWFFFSLHFISSLHCHCNFFRNFIRCIIVHVMDKFGDVPSCFFVFAINHSTAMSIFVNISLYTFGGCYFKINS